MKEKYTTLHLNLNPKKAKRDLLESLLNDTNEVVELHSNLIKTNKTVDRKFHHEILYKKCRKKFPNLHATSIQLIRDEVIRRGSDEKIFLPILLSPQSFKLSKSEKSNYFDAWLKFKKINFPLEGKDVIKKLMKMGIVTTPKLAKRYEKNNEIDLLEHEQKVDQKNGHTKVIGHSKTSPKEYSLVRAFIKKNFKNNTWKLYLIIKTTIDKKSPPPVNPSTKITEKIHPFEGVPEISTNITNVYTKIIRPTSSKKDCSRIVDVLRFKKNLSDNYKKKIKRPRYMKELLRGIRDKECFGYYLLHNLINRGLLEVSIHNYI